MSETATGNELLTQMDEVKNITELILFLWRHYLGLSKKAFEIQNEKINDCDFLKLTEEKLEHYGMKMGPATGLQTLPRKLRKN
jgi:hypothetical protein